jgi:GNAT superfamily N-acetyltransferase
VDNPVWDALNGPHARFAETSGTAVRYPAEVAPFAAFANPGPGPGAGSGSGPGAGSGALPETAWKDLAQLVDRGGDQIAIVGPALTAPPGWQIGWQDTGLQFIGDDVVPLEDDPEIVPLTGADVPQMLDLVALTKPGPFRSRTIELGAYLGIRRGGRLIAMAGERMHLPGNTEISAVCTDPAHRGQGLGGRLVRAVSTGILRRGKVPFLHSTSSNTNAIRLYGALGFRLRRRITFTVLSPT